MLAKFFHRSEPISFVFMMIWLAFLVFFHLAKTVENRSGVSFILYSTGLFFFFAGFMFYVDFFIQRYKLSAPNYYAHFFFLTLLGLFAEVLDFNITLISFGFIVLVVNNILSLRNKEFISLKLYNSGFFLGIAYFFFPFSILYILLIYIGYFIYLKIVDKRLLIPIIGFITPYILVFTYFYWTGQIQIFKNWTELNISTGLSWLKNINTSLPILIYGLILVLLTIKLMSIGSFSELEEERNYKVLITFLIISLLVILINSKGIKQIILWTFFPAIFIIGNSVHRIKRNWLKESIFFIAFFTSLMVFLL